MTARTLPSQSLCSVRGHLGSPWHRVCYRWKDSRRALAAGSGPGARGSCCRAGGAREEKDRARWRPRGLW